MTVKNILKARRTRWLGLGVLCTAAITGLMTMIGTTSLQTTEYTVASDRLPPELDGFRIVLISDFHLHPFGEKEGDLIRAVWDAKPDMIALAGDIIDKKHDSMENIRDLLEGISGKVPVYAVAGNHELANTERFGELLELYRRYGVQYLNGSVAELSKNGASVKLCSARLEPDDFAGKKLLYPNPDRNYFNLLLLHYGNKFQEASALRYDLVLAGHVHGGLIRLPFVGGIIGNGSLFPQYTAGIYRSGESVMVLSRGLGDAVIPRIFNARELVAITLMSSG